MKKTNKLPMEQILVITGDQALPTGNFNTSGTAINLANGQIGVMSFDINSTVRPLGQYLVDGDDSTEVQAIKLVQGTGTSSNTQLSDIWEVGEKSHVESGIIRNDRIRSVMTKLPRFATLGAQAATNFDTPKDLGVYNAFLSLGSTRFEKEYGVTNSNSMYADAPVVNFTAEGTVSPLDFILTNMVSDFNSQSKAVTSNTHRGNQPFVVFGVKLAGGAGQALGTITPATQITFQTVNGVNQILTSSVELVQTLARLVQDSALTVTSTIEVVDITTAGAAAKIDALIVVGLPQSLAAYYDDVEQRMVFPRINFGGDFIAETDPTVVTAYPSEGTGHSRKWNIQNRKRAQLNVHTKQNHPDDDWFSEGVSYINLAKAFYTSYIIEYYDTESTLTQQVQSPKRTTLLFRGEPLSSFTVTVTNVVTRIAANDTPIPFVTSTDAGTGTVSAVTVAAVNTVLSDWLEHARVTYGSFPVGGDAVAGGVYLL
jgi:hypothetical protein